MIASPPRPLPVLLRCLLVVTLAGVPGAAQGTGEPSEGPPPVASPGRGNTAERPRPERGHGPRGAGGAAAEGRVDASPAPQPTPPAGEEVEVTLSDQGVSLFCVSADAHEVFTTLGQRTNTRLIVDDTVDRKLTVNLTDKTVEQIITEIVATYGLSFAEVNGIYMISVGIAEGPSSYLLGDIESVRTKYVLASRAKDLLPLFLRQHVQVNSEQNAVVLSGPKPVLEKFREDIERFDIPAEQIMFEILVVEFTDTGLHEFDSRLGWANDGLGGTSKAVDDATDPGQLVFRGMRELPQEFFTELQALVSAGRARVRANPSVATLSGNEAELFIGLQRFLQTPVELAGRGSSRVESLNFVEAGVNLGLTPFTAGQGEILVQLTQEVSTLGALDPVTRLPDKTIRKAATNVRVRDGETVIIGGLIQQEERQSRRKVPVLGDLPLVGSLFRSNKVERRDTELVIFITPRVLTQTGHLPAAVEDNLRKRFLGADAPASAPGQ